MVIFTLQWPLMCCTASRDTIHVYSTKRESSEWWGPSPPPSHFTRRAKQCFPPTHVEQVWTPQRDNKHSEHYQTLLRAMPYVVNAKKKKVWRRETQAQVRVFQFYDLGMYRVCEFGMYTICKGGGKGIHRLSLKSTRVGHVNKEVGSMWGQGASEKKNNMSTDTHSSISG